MSWWESHEVKYFFAGPLHTYNHLSVYIYTYTYTYQLKHDCFVSWIMVLEDACIFYENATTCNLKMPCTPTKRSTILGERNCSIRKWISTYMYAGKFIYIYIITLYNTIYIYPFLLVLLCLTCFHYHQLLNTTHALSSPCIVSASSERLSKYFLGLWWLVL